MGHKRSHTEVVGRLSADLTIHDGNVGRDIHGGVRVCVLSGKGVATEVPPGICIEDRSLLGPFCELLKSLRSADSTLYGMTVGDQCTRLD